MNDNADNNEAQGWKKKNDISDTKIIDEIVDDQGL